MRKLVPYLAVLTAICFLGSFVPFLGVLFALPLNDLLIFLIAVFIVTRINASFLIHVALSALLWATLSLCLELTRINHYFSGVRGMLAPYSAINGQLDSSKKVIALHGNLNPILYASGPRYAYETTINVAGMRSFEGTSQFNRASTLDLVNGIFGRGWIPKIDSPAYPRITVQRLTKGGSEQLSIVLQKTEALTIAKFERVYSLPPPHPGSAEGIGVVLQIFYHNFLREALQLNQTVQLHQEVNDFLNATLGFEISKETDLPFSQSKINQSDVVLPINQIEKGIDDFINSQNLLWHNSSEADFLSRCPFAIRPKEFGSDNSGRTYVNIAAHKQNSEFIRVLRHVSPDDVNFSYWCDSNRESIRAFGRYGRNFKLTKFDKTGRLTSVDFVRNSTRLENRIQIIGSSVIETGSQVSAFSLVMPIVTEHSPHEVRLNDRVRRLDFSIQSSNQ